MEKVLIGIYLFFVGFFLFGCGAVVYHLLAYKINKKFSYLAVFVFLLIAIVLLAANITLAYKFNWGELVDSLNFF